MCLIDPLFPYAGGLFFGWNALSIMIKDLDNFAEGCATTNSTDATGQLPCFLMPQPPPYPFSCLYPYTINLPLENAPQNLTLTFFHLQVSLAHPQTQQQ